MKLSAATDNRRVLYSRIIVSILILITVAISSLLYQATKSNISGSQLPSYSLKLEIRNRLVRFDTFNFVITCFSSGGYLCTPKSSQANVPPGLFSLVNLSSSVATGTYQGIKVQINGDKGRSLDVKSVTLQGKQIFDGSDFSVFKNVKGIKVSRDKESGLVVFDITSDKSSFELDCLFTAENAIGTAAAVKYTSALLFAVIFLSIILLLSVFGKSLSKGKILFASKTGRLNRSDNNHVLKAEVKNAVSGQSAQRKPVQSMGTGVMAATLRVSLVAAVFDLLMIIMFVCCQLFVFNEFSVAAENDQPFMVEVSGSPDFGYTAGSANFYSGRENLIKVPKRFSTIRISRITDNPAEERYQVNYGSGRCSVKNGMLESEGDLPCSIDVNGRMYIYFSSMQNTVMNIVFSAMAALALLGIMYFAFQFIEFNKAIRLILVFIMVAAYITGEICMNVEFSNVLFYKNYIQLLPDVVLKNICLILFIFLLAELSFSRGFICSGTFLQVLLLTIAYIAIDWGVSKNFNLCG